MAVRRRRLRGCSSQQSQNRAHAWPHVRRWLWAATRRPRSRTPQTAPLAHLPSSATHPTHIHRDTARERERERQNGPHAREYERAHACRRACMDRPSNATHAYGEGQVVEDEATAVLVGRRERRGACSWRRCGLAHLAHPHTLFLNITKSTAGSGRSSSSVGGGGGGSGSGSMGLGIVSLKRTALQALLSQGGNGCGRVGRQRTRHADTYMGQPVCVCLYVCLRVATLHRVRASA
jgi:hypothetical protein